MSMIRMNNRYLLLALLFVCTLVKAQTASKDFVLINEAYAKAKSVSMQVNYTLFKSWSSNDILQKQTGEMKWKGPNQLYTRIGESETFRFSDYLMSVNHENKRVMLMAVVGNDNNSQSKTSFGKIDTLLKFCKTVDYSKEPDGNAAYTLTFDKKYELGKVKITFNTKTWFITQLIFFYNLPLQMPEGAETVEYITRLQIDYTNISTRAAISDTELSYNKYILMKNNKPELRKEFSAYTFSDQYSAFRKKVVQKK